MSRSGLDEQPADRVRNALWGALGGMAFCATMMTVMMVAGPKLMGRVCGKMKGMMQTCDTEAPIDTIKRRYASGEIDEEEFQYMKQELAK